MIARFDIRFLISEINLLRKFQSIQNCIYKFRGKSIVIIKNKLHRS